MRTKLKVDHARFMGNGILFYSKRHEGYIAVSIVDEMGNIKTEWTTIEKYRKEKNKSNKIENAKKILILSFLPFSLIFSLVLDRVIISKGPIWGIRFLFIFFAFIILYMFVMYIVIEKKIEKNIFKFHSAEHMVLNAYSKLKRVPFLEEIKRYSRYSNGCGTNIITLIFIWDIMMFFWTFVSDISVIVFVLYILWKCGKLNFLQIFTTSEPTDKELLVAIAGLSVWLENEKKEKEKF